MTRKFAFDMGKRNTYNSRMFLVLDDITALQFYRLRYPQNRKPTGFASLPQEHSGVAVREQDVWSFAPAWVTPHFLETTGGKIGAMGFGRIQFRQSKSHRVKVWSGRIPDDAFHDLGDEVFVPSVPFTFLLMASRLSLIQLIALGHELCGKYTFDESDPRGLRKREAPLSSGAEMSAFVDRAAGLYGHNKAKRALRYIADGSASPMETRDKMQFCMPFMYGGYALGPHEFNHEVVLDRQAAQIARKSKCRVDHYWPSIGEGCEYQSVFDHLSIDDYSDDRARINALRSMGYPIYELTKRHVSDIGQFEAIAVMLAKKLHKRIPASRCGATPERLALRHELEQWNARAGRVW